MPTTTDLISYPDQASWAGGDLITIARSWGAAALPLSCAFEVADVSLPCSTGRDDQGYKIVPLGKTVAVAIPALPSRLWQRQAGRLVFTDAGGTRVFTLPMPVVPPFYDTCTYTLRSDLPPRWAVGPRSILSEPPARPTNLGALTGTVGLGLSLFAGLRQTRLAQSASRGDTSLYVERSEGLPDPGRVSIGRATYRYRGATPGQLNNVQAEVGGELVSGALADHEEGSPVTDLSGTFSEVDSLRRSLFIDTAGGADLAVIGRLLGVPRAPSLSGDDQYRALIKAMGYAPRGSEQTLEKVLNIIVGPGKYEIGKDPFNNPGQVVVTIPGGEPVQAVSMGRAYVSGAVNAVPDAQGAFATDAPVVGVGSLTLAEPPVAEDLTHALPSARWARSNTQAPIINQTALGASLPGIQTALTLVPRGLGPGGTLELTAQGFISGGSTARGVVNLVADDGQRRATVQLMPLLGTLLAAFVGPGNQLLSPMVSIGTAAPGMVWRLRVSAAGARFEGGTQRLSLAAGSLPASSAPGVSVAPSDPSKSDWSLALSSLGGRFTSSRDFWTARAQATAVDAQTVTLSPACADPSDAGKRVMLGGQFYRVAQVVGPDSLKLARDVGRSGQVSRAQGVSYLGAGSVPFRFPDDLGNSVEILGDDAQEAGTYTITALYGTAGGRDLSTYQTRIGQNAQVARLDGNPQPAVGLSYRIATRLSAGKTDTLVIGGAGTVVVQGSRVIITPRQALPDNTATYAVNTDRVLSAQLVDGSTPVVERFGLAPPYTFSIYPFFAHDPFDLVETYLPGTMPVGTPVQVNYGT